MSIADVTENAILNLIFRGTAWANYADNAAASPETNIHTGLHTADPGDAGTMSTSEVAYTSYARTNVLRSTGFSASVAGSTSPAATISFPAGTGGSGTVTHFSTGKTGGGAAAILFSGTVTPSIVTGSGVTPQLTTSTTITLDASWIATIMALILSAKLWGLSLWASLGAML